MATKQKNPKSRKPDSGRLIVTEEKGKSKLRKLTEVQLSPTVNNAITAQSYHKRLSVEMDLTEAFEVLQEKCEKVIAGDLNELEATLTAQIVTLNGIYTNLASRSANSDYLSQMETYMRLSLKAQSQCTRTAEVLAAIKNPPLLYAKQANIAHGHQQVNNSVSPHAGKTKNSQNELLSEANNAALDTRGAAEAGRINQEMETVGAINRCKDS